MNYEPPLEFVTVEQPSTEAARKREVLFRQNSRAANPDADQDTDKPKLNGKQTDVPKTEDVPRPDFNKPQPAAPAPPQPQMQLAMNAGDLTMGKPDRADAETGTAAPAHAPCRRTRSRPTVCPACKCEQEGGVRIARRSCRRWT